MKKTFYFAAMAAFFLASCSSENEVTPENNPSAASQEAVGFDTYASRTTRATDAQNVTLEYLKKENIGFGVFAFDQGTQALTSYTTTNATPTFFYNQQVKWNTAGNVWEYSPLKYWPNTEGNKVSFYAYAPYQKDLSTNATPNKAGLRLILATNSYGPAIQYTVPSGLSAGVDLCWGADASLTTGDITSPINRVKNTTTGENQTITTTDRIKFNFKHALTKIAFNIQAHYDEETNGDNKGTNRLDKNTTITVRSIKLVGSFASKGVLSLYNGEWNAEKGVSQEVELLSQAIVMKAPETTDATNNDDYIAEAELFNGDAIMLIPGGSFQIKVTYDVETTDATNTANSSKVTNTVTSKDSYDLVAGQATAYHLNLGMTSVKFDAQVTDWADKAATEVELPNNTKGN